MGVDKILINKKERKKAERNEEVFFFISHLSLNQQLND